MKYTLHFIYHLLISKYFVSGLPDICARLYDNGGWNGTLIALRETDNIYLNDQVSSVNVTKGCTLQLYQDFNKDGLLGTFTGEVDFSDDPAINNQASSASCNCQGKFCSKQWWILENCMTIQPLMMCVFKF